MGGGGCPVLSGLQLFLPGISPHHSGSYPTPSPQPSVHWVICPAIPQNVYLAQTCARDGSWHPEPTGSPQILKIRHEDCSASCRMLEKSTDPHCPQKKRVGMGLFKMLSQVFKGIYLMVNVTNWKPGNCPEVGNENHSQQSGCS